MSELLFPKISSADAAGLADAANLGLGKASKELRRRGIRNVIMALSSKPLLLPLLAGAEGSHDTPVPTDEDVAVVAMRTLDGNVIQAD